MKTQPGFVAALDQSGGSTPHALALYGIKDHAWKDDDEMFELVHHMRTRVITSPNFTGERIRSQMVCQGLLAAGSAPLAPATAHGDGCRLGFIGPAIHDLGDNKTARFRSPCRSEKEGRPLPTNGTHSA
jgi:hypothetical protein